MKQLGVFIKKEMLEALRQYKIFILLVVFIGFGLISPVTAKFMPDILKNFVMEGMSITLPLPTYIDSWLQFFKNMSQIVLIVVLILYAGILVEEYSKNTIRILRTKGLKSSSVIFGKFIAGAFIVSLCYLGGFLANILYTWIYFKETLNINIGVAALGLLLFYFFLIALFIFWGSVMKRLRGVLLTAGASLGVLFLLNIKESFKGYNPISLLGLGVGDLGGAKDYLGAYVVTMGLILLMLLLGVYFFRRKEL